MEYSIKEKQIEAVLTSVNLDASIDGGRVDVVIGDAAKMDVAEALNYIKSGQAEVQQVVDAGTATFNENASTKTEAFNDNASSKTADFNTNASTKTTAFDENASSKLSEYNSNATEKLSAYNTNATEKTTAFNTNYAEKKALIDEQVGIATTQAGIATAKASEASQSATSASQSATSAETYAGQAESSATEASTSATNAYASEVNAGQSASDASDSATTATTQAGIATTKASEASQSATNASNSASSASSSASTATTQAGIATTKASEASTSASNASLSEQNASSYADSASQSALDAATSETNASQSASNASQSASTATNQASIATSKATEASSSATSASNSASSASSSATTATNQANIAKQYAIGEPSEPTEHSAKYWAEQAESELSVLSSRVTTIEGNYVTTDTAQDISAKKTFLGEKAILFKQTATTDKLGFTFYNTSGSELGALEYRPNTISGGALINLNTSQSGTSWLGFRYWSNINIIAPKPSNGNYYIPVNFTDGTNTVTASSNGTVNLSSILPNSAVWGNITGTLSNQTDLNNALDGKYDASNPAGYTSNVGTVTSVNNTQPDANGNVTISTGGSYTAGTGIDITNDAISVTAPTLTNTATGANGLTINGVASNQTNAVNIGYNSTVTASNGTAIGAYTKATDIGATALGNGAHAQAERAIQLGFGTNSEANSFYVGTSSSDNWKMLDSAGLIPDARISSNIARTSDVPTYTAGTGISISSNTISIASPTLTNAATGSGNLVVGGSQPVSTGNTSFGFYSSTSLEGTALGYGATSSGSQGVAIGWGSNATANYSTALGTKSTSSGMFAIQIGRGTNSTDYSLSIGFDSTGNYQLLDGTTGLIPDARISSNIARTSSIPTVDQTYDGTSTNAQSGVAVAQALSSVSVSKDNLSITNNANNQLQTVGVIDQNDTTQAIKTWTGTLAQYNAIATKDPDTLYNITDDTDFTLTLLETLYPVGSIYITTASTCPLSTLISGSTWELVSSGRVLQGADSGHSAGTTVEAGLPNITGDLHNNADRNDFDNIEDGCFRRTGVMRTWAAVEPTSASSFGGVYFDASYSNSIYGNSTTVQPPAYFVNIYRRTA